MAMTQRQKKWLVGILIPLEVASCALAWRDLVRRPDEKVRGKKNVWRTFITINPGNSLFYWLFGRLRTARFPTK